MVQFTATIHKFGKKGEKTGWTYFELPADIVQQLKPGNKKEFKVKTCEIVLEGMAEGEVK